MFPHVGEHAVAECPIGEVAALSVAAFDDLPGEGAPLLDVPVPIVVGADNSAEPLRFELVGSEEVPVVLVVVDELENARGVVLVFRGGRRNQRGAFTVLVANGLQ